jgi:hypothetical protein
MPLLPSAVLQFCDENGAPYALGTIDFFVPNTETRKNTWSDPGASVLNTNPVTLDAAGRAIIVGNGAYRMVLKDHAGNTIWDQVTDSLVSTAMLAVTDAATLADARTAMGVTAAIAVETSRATAAEAAEVTRAVDAEATLGAGIAAEITRAEGAEASLATGITTEATARAAGDAGLQAQIDGLPSPSIGVTARDGSSTSGIAGVVAISFSPAFGTRALTFAVVDSHAICSGTLYVDFSGGALTESGANGILACDAGFGGSPVVGGMFDWYSTGY